MFNLKHRLLILNLKNFMKEAKLNNSLLYQITNYVRQMRSYLTSEFKLDCDEVNGMKWQN